MILAAGLGTRMRPLTDHVPKPMLKVGGKPLIAWHLERLSQAGIEQVVVNASWQRQALVDFLGDGSRWGMQLSISVEPQPLETAGGIRKVLPLLGESAFVLINGDVWSDFPIESLVNRTLGDSLADLVLVNNPTHHLEGDFDLVDGLVSGCGPRSYTFSGISKLSPDLFSKPLGSRLGDYLRAAAAEQRVMGECYQGQWVDVGTPERLSFLNQRVSNSQGC